jgi:hypothetical protein
MFGNILKNANSPFTEGEELRRFLAPVTISTLRSWARHPGAPYQFHIALEKRDLHLGRSPTEYQRMPIPEAFWQVIPALPRISDTDISSPSIAPEDHTPKTIE